MVLAGQFGRMLRRRAHERDGSDGLAEAAPAAAIDTVNVAVSGYTATPRSETVLFNLLAGFLGSFALVRTSTWGIRKRWWPFRNVRVGGRHIHHFVPGIVLALLSGGVSIAMRHEHIDRWLALPFGAGAALILDETALLIELNDVYWSERDGLSIDVGLGATTGLACLALVVRVVRRGEALVLGSDPAT